MSGDPADGFDFERVEELQRAAEEFGYIAGQAIPGMAAAMASMVGVLGKCLTCCVAAKLGQQDRKDIEEAVTVVPDWQSTIVNGQLIAACVPVPVCWEHLTVTGKTAVDQGRLVTG